MQVDLKALTGASTNWGDATSRVALIALQQTRELEKLKEAGGEATAVVLDDVGS